MRRYLLEEHKSYHAPLISLFIIYVFVDFFRRFVSGSQLPLFVLDLNILLIYYSFFKYKKINVVLEISAIFRLFFLAYVLLITLQVGNLSLPDITTTIAGLRTYLLPIPFLFIGYYVYQYNPNFIKKLGFVIKVLGVMSIGFGILVFFTKESIRSEVLFSLLTPLEHSAHSFGANEQSLTSSFFASSTRFSIFIFISYMFVWAGLKSQLKSGYFFIFFFLLYLSGNFISGNRTMLFLFLLLNIALLPFMRWQNKMYILGFFTTVVGYFLIFGHEIYDNNENNFLIRLDYMFDDVSQYFKRLEMAFPIARINTDSDIFFFGLGIGKYGAEANLSPLIDMASVDQVYKSFQYIDQYPIDDGGFVKVFLELGFIGFLFFFMFMGQIIYSSIRSVYFSYITNDHYTYAISLFPIFWIITFSKGHGIISDIFISSFFYFSIGILLSKLASLKSRVKNCE